MAVDTSIQFNGYNSYKFNQNDVLHCYPFGVENMEYITHSFAAYSPIALSDKVRATTKFFDTDSEIIQTVDHSFDISQGTFDKREITVAVPQGAIKAQLTFLNDEVDPWWVATPKTEEGQTATPYAINAYGQLTYITPNGVYTGTITANQIVLTSDESLGERLATINANQIQLESKVEGIEPKVTKITSDGVYTGEIEANQITANTLSAISADLGTVTAGTINGVTVNSANINGGNIHLSGNSNATPSSTVFKIDATNIDASMLISGGVFRGYRNGALSFQINNLLSSGVGLILYNPSDSTNEIQLNSALGSVSAKSFIDNTPFYEGDALLEIKKIKGINGELDHSTLPEFARKKINKSKPKDKAINKENQIMVEVEEEGRDLGAMISMLTVAVQQLTERVEKLEGVKG